MVCEEKWWSNKCDSNVDKRYDSTVTPDISNLHPLFGAFEGLWFGRWVGYDGDLVETKPDQWYPYPWHSVVAANITVDGTRFIHHDYFVYHPVSADFCMSNVTTKSLDNGTCGVNGYFDFGSQYRVSTHEKRNELIGATSTGAFVGSATGRFNQTTTVGNRNQLVDTWYLEDLQPGMEWEYYITTTYTMNDARTSYLVEATHFDPFGEVVTIPKRDFYNMTRVDSVEEWRQLVRISLDENNVTEETRSSMSTIFDTGDCTGMSGCPIDNPELWCKVGDASPQCGVTPYFEATTVNAGLVGGLTAALAVIVLGIAIFVMKKIQRGKVEDEKDRLRTLFGAHIITSLGIGKDSPADALSVGALQKEFGAIDVSGDGTISKAEFKDFLTSGKMGEVPDSDFNALFGIIDIDESGEIDFVEFTTFMGQIRAILENNEFKDSSGQRHRLDTEISMKQSSRNLISMKQSSRNL